MNPVERRVICGVFPGVGPSVQDIIDSADHRRQFIGRGCLVVALIRRQKRCKILPFTLWRVRETDAEPVLDQPQSVDRIGKQIVVGAPRDEKIGA